MVPVLQQAKCRNSEIPGSVLGTISYVNQDSVWIRPAKPDHLFETSEDVFANVVSAKGLDGVHEVNDSRGVLGEVDAHHPLASVLVISVANERNSDLNKKQQSKFKPNLCTTTTLGEPKTRSSFRAGRYPEEIITN